MRTLATFVVLVFATLFYGSAVILADLMRMKKGPGTLFDRYPRSWANALLRVAGVDVVVHNPERMHSERPLVFAANHVSWFDVLAMASVLPHYSFIAKAELFRIPIFGRGARAVGTIPIDRNNRKSAFASYEEAAEKVKGGACIVVYPEGTRGPGYPLRPFKKGPFVLAIAAKAPVVPTLVHGTIEILGRGSFNVKPGTIHVHLLEPVDPDGMTYDDRDRLAAIVRDRMAAELERLYGVKSLPNAAERRIA
jgi:1-acyl-sn-glycerol-3-phosphate acyltransferase